MHCVNAAIQRHGFLRPLNLDYLCIEFQLFKNDVRINLDKKNAMEPIIWPANNIGAKNPPALVISTLSSPGSGFSPA